MGRRFPVLQGWRVPDAIGFRFLGFWGLRELISYSVAVEYSLKVIKSPPIFVSKTGQRISTRQEWVRHREYLWVIRQGSGVSIGE